MSRLIILVCLLYGGCVMTQPEARSRAYLSSAYPPDAPLRTNRTVGDSQLIFSRFGYAFPDPAIVSEVDASVRARQKQGHWAARQKIEVSGEVWRTEIRGDLLFFLQVSGTKAGFSEFYAAPGGQIGIDVKYAPVLDKLEPLMMELTQKSSGGGAGFVPPVFIK